MQRLFLVKHGSRCLRASPLAGRIMTELSSGRLQRDRACEHRRCRRTRSEWTRGPGAALPWRLQHMLAASTPVQSWVESQCRPTSATLFHVTHWFAPPATRLRRRSHTQLPCFARPGAPMVGDVARRHRQTSGLEIALPQSCVPHLLDASSPTLSAALLHALCHPTIKKCAEVLRAVPKLLLRRLGPCA